MNVKVNLSGDPKKDKAAFESAMKEFKKLMKRSGIMDELRERESYMSPSKYKRYRKNEAIKRRKREESRQARTKRYYGE